MRLPCGRHPTVVSRIHSILPRVALALAVPGAVAVFFAYRSYTQPYTPPDGNPFAVAEGRWAWTTTAGGCGNDWHRITFSPDRSVMTITSSKPYKLADGTLDSVAVYDIQASGPGWIRGAIRGETRKTPDGRLVVWDLVLRSPNRYAWHRTDWFRGGYTREIHRCD